MGKEEAGHTGEVPHGAEEAVRRGRPLGAIVGPSRALRTLQGGQGAGAEGEGGALWTKETGWRKAEDFWVHCRLLFAVDWGKNKQDLVGWVAIASFPCLSPLSLPLFTRLVSSSHHRFNASHPTLSHPI